MHIKTPRVALSPVALECVVVNHFPLRDHREEPAGSHLLIAEVVGVSISQDMIANGVFSWGATRTVVRAGGPADYHVIGKENLLQMMRPK